MHQVRLDALRARLNAAEAHFRTETALISGRTTWVVEIKAPHLAMAQHACGADWIVAVRPALDESHALVPPPSSLILGAGIPILLAPDAAPPLLARRIVVGWHNGRAAQRAIADAMPLLCDAERVHLVSIDVDGPEPSAQESLMEVHRRLRLRGCVVEAESRPLCWPGAAATLANLADNYDADLIVIGGFSRMHLPRNFADSLSAELIEHCSRWLLLSH
ncbi:MAG: universal stress protein [Caulobacteraceae bacterium]